MHYSVYVCIYLSVEQLLSLFVVNNEEMADPFAYRLQIPMRMVSLCERVVKYYSSCKSSRIRLSSCLERHLLSF